MLSQFYDTKVDIWGLGCMFYELAYMVDNVEHDPDDRILFKGNSCFPLSPKKNNDDDTINLSKND